MVESTLAMEERKINEQAAAEAELVHNMAAMYTEEKEESKNAQAEEKVTFRQSKDEKVRWYFDGHIRHRLQSTALRNRDTVVDLKRRQDAVGTTRDYPEDTVVTYLTKHAEEIFEPKRILTNGDWLKSFREPDQFFSKYKNCNNGSHKWIEPTKNKLYLFMMDDYFTEADVQKYKKYAQAFFPGTDVDLIQ